MLYLASRTSVLGLATRRDQQCGRALVDVRFLQQLLERVHVRCQEQLILGCAATCFDSTMCSSRAVGTGTPSTRNSRRSIHTVSKSNPAITSVRSISSASGPVTRVSARRSTIRSASQRSRGRSSGSSPSQRSRLASWHASQAAYEIVRVLGEEEIEVVRSEDSLPGWSVEVGARDADEDIAHAVVRSSRASGASGCVTCEAPA